MFLLYSTIEYYKQQQLTFNTLMQIFEQNNSKSKNFNIFSNKIINLMYFRQQYPPNYQPPNYQPPLPSQHFHLRNSIPFATSIQYQDKQPLKNQPQNSTQMVQLIKESQDLKKQITEVEKNIKTTKENVQRLEQLIDFMEKKQDE
ncbi:hypothetical protein pb186bvf_018992 [Paramecium bursaria]